MITALFARPDGQIRFFLFEDSWATTCVSEESTLLAEIFSHSLELRLVFRYYSFFFYLLVVFCFHLHELNLDDFMEIFLIHLEFGIYFFRFERQNCS